MKPSITRAALLAAGLCLLTACLEVEETVTIYPDGSGRVEGKTVFGEQLSTLLDMAANQGNKELEKSVLEGIGFNGEGVTPTRSTIVKEDKNYRAEFAAVCRNIGKATAHDSRSPTPPCTIENQKDGTFVVILGDEKATREGAPAPVSDQEVEMMNTMLKGFKLTATYILPGEITRVDGPDGLATTRGRSLTIRLDADTITALMKNGITAPARRLKVTCAAPSPEVMAEWRSFLTDIEQAEKNAKDKDTSR